MDTELIKSNLRKYYNTEAEIRDGNLKESWKKKERENFYEYIKNENKSSLLEIGAGAGYDSCFFMDSGLDVTAVDLSSEMVKICREKSINAYELDFYNLSSLGKKFDCIWAMNTLLHVPKADLPEVLDEIDFVLNDGGIFYMGVYGGIDSENDFINDVTETPRFFSYYSEENLKNILSKTFEIIEFNQFDVGRNIDFQSVIMRKK